MRSDRDWQIKKEISLPALVGWGIQAGAFIWFLAVLHQRVDSIEKQASAYAPQTSQIAVLSSQIENVKDGISEIKGLIRNGAGGKRSDVIR